MKSSVGNFNITVTHTHTYKYSYILDKFTFLTEFNWFFGHHDSTSLMISHNTIKSSSVMMFRLGFTTYD